MDSRSSFIAARLVALEGDAWQRQDGTRLSLVAGSVLTAGDVLETGPDAVLQLQLASGHALSLGPEQLLSLDADVLATADADPGEWCCAAPEALRLLLGGSALALDNVLDAAQGLDHLLGSDAAHVPAAAHGAPHALVAFDDPGLSHLLRSLFGPEAH